ncbi:MAG: hypothetical protein AAF657_13880 [Acidobacteriota bacterium]
MLGITTRPRFRFGSLRCVSSRALVPGLALALVLLASSQAEARIFADGFESGDFSAWSGVVGLQPTVFRISDLDLRDPHVFAPVDVGIVICVDFTDDPLPVVDFAFNGSLEEQITTDGDGDGFLDLSSLLVFRPFFVNAAMSERVDFDDGQCTAPLASTICGPDPATTQLETIYSNLMAGTCLETVAGTTSSYDPAVTEPDAPCFSTVAETFTFQLGELEIELEDLQLAGTFVGLPVTGFTSGLLRGFLSEAAADAILLPDELPLVGGQPLSILLPGGSGACSDDDDRDLHNGVLGWWFYFNFEAEKVPVMGF